MTSCWRRLASLRAVLATLWTHRRPDVGRGLPAGLQAGQTWTASQGDTGHPLPRPVRTYEWDPGNPAPNERENLDVYVSVGPVARQADAYLARIGWCDAVTPQATP